MRKLKAPRLVTVAIITTATIIFWIFFEVYRIFTSTADVDVPEELLRPLNPTLDRQSLQKVQEKIFFEESEIPENPIISPLTEIPEVELSPTAIPEEEAEISAETSPTPTATASAETQNQ